MYTLEFETLKKMVEIYNFLNQVEVKGSQNLQLLYSSLFGLQEIINELDKQGREQDEGIKISNLDKAEK